VVFQNSTGLLAQGMKADGMPGISRVQLSASVDRKGRLLRLGLLLSWQPQVCRSIRWLLKVLIVADGGCPD
jgi:hypothetical protein